MLQFLSKMSKAVRPGPTAQQTLAIVGGGFAGASVARFLAESGIKDLQILVFEPRETLGAGLAYDTQDPSLRLNVEASRMIAIPDEPSAFADWLKTTSCLTEDPDSVVDGDIVGAPQIFARREAFGRFMADRMAPYLADGAIRHIRETVETVTKVGGRWLLTGNLGAWVEADFLVIAATHPAPKAPRALQSALQGHPRFITNPAAGAALSSIRDQDRVLVVGTGLTAADIVASLSARGHCGEITAFSRRGMASKGHHLAPQSFSCCFSDEECSSARKLLAAVRRTIADAQSQGVTWHAVTDALRKQGLTLWTRLSETERKRFLRHARRLWDVHRYRLPPQAEAVWQQRLADGSLTLSCGRLIKIERGIQTIAVDLVSADKGLVERKPFDWVVLATGPDHASVLKSQSMYLSLESTGHLQADAYGLGIACDTAGRATGIDGLPQDDLFIAGPLARGTFGELMGVPEVARQAELVASGVAEALAVRQNAVKTPS
ncbi:FAD/NAD(P)-binding protein [Allorhizobium taibaishanense]|nr:FAD/NAD(P)-binding protein [Allorhizobium taibaishanense]MBB4008502.1 putative NAD(P)/FAD-binding protein YdhS [Allorhizobium taibaishanense]